MLVLNETPDGEKASKHPFDLEERTARFGEAIVRFLKKIPRSPTNDRLIDQLVGCGTSIGGNYCEANEGISKRDFRHMISRCVKESKETKFFLRMLAAAEPQLADEARMLGDEALRTRMGDAGLARVSGRFTVDQMIAGTAAVYARVAGRPHAADSAGQPAHD